MSGKVIEEIDLIDVIGFIDRKGRVFQRKMLDSIESELKENPEQFLVIRKIILDGLNDYKRAILTIIFGSDFEGNMK